MNTKTLISTLLLLPLAACSATPSKSELDAEVKRLCAIDGGIKVYETVRLPAERFDQHGNVRIPSKTKAKPTDEYYYDSETVYLREGDPTVIRMVTRIVRRNDEKVLGESVRYARGGGHTRTVASIVVYLSKPNRKTIPRTIYLFKGEF